MLQFYRLQAGLQLSQRQRLRPCATVFLEMQVGTGGRKYTIWRGIIRASHWGGGVSMTRSGRYAFGGRAGSLGIQDAGCA
jgi:hypothetical protein